MLQAHLYSQDDQDHLEIREVFNVHIQLYEPCTQTFFSRKKKLYNCICFANYLPDSLPNFIKF